MCLYYGLCYTLVQLIRKHMVICLPELIVFQYTSIHACVGVSPDVCVQLKENLLQLSLLSVTLQLTGHQVLLQPVVCLLAVSCLRETYT